MLKIGDFSRLSRMSVRMLRHYDELGLLTPLYTDPASGYRYYGPAQLSRANRIRAFRDMGFGLQSIGLLLQQGDDKDAILAPKKTGFKNLEFCSIYIVPGPGIRLAITVERKDAVSIP